MSNYENVCSNNGDDAFAKYRSVQGPLQSKRQRKHTNLSAICCVLWVPWLLFVAMYADMSFSLHYNAPGLCYVVAALGCLLVLVFFGLAATSSIKRYHGELNADPVWFIFLFLTCLAAVTAGISFGSINYWNNMLPYFDIHNLNAYPGVNPAQDSGSQMMDAGQISFVPDARIDVSRSMGFKNQDVYCVAPITVGDSSLSTYDFWAVGLDCCTSTVGGNYQCGEYDNTNAHSGLRMMREDQRSFYRLAVEQAKAKYGIESEHPIFFYWVQDPEHTLETYESEGTRYFCLGIGVFFAFQLFATILAVVVNHKIRH